ncbi:hypothetical protein Glove_30g40 [Diversispora epigaea]|uniref:Zn(2)-C6 fungal-type domain-containing protein n=1 Tax=Diversispora epigaea TaxID=1348612 RepID=A0A397JRL2_9GLOM|nr:hypothetical protein Glove_30g40 [Diversispora epigaea]
MRKVKHIRSACNSCRKKKKRCVPQNNTCLLCQGKNCEYTIQKKRGRSRRDNNDLSYLTMSLLTMGPMNFLMTMSLLTTEVSIFTDSMEMKPILIHLKSTQETAISINSTKLKSSTLNPNDPSDKYLWSKNLNTSSDSHKNHTNCNNYFFKKPLWQHLIDFNLLIISFDQKKIKIGRDNQNELSNNNESSNNDELSFNHGNETDTLEMSVCNLMNGSYITNVYVM